MAKGFVQSPISSEMREFEDFREKDKSHEPTPRTKKVYTDGGCIKVPGGSRAGYGVYWGEGDQINEARALRGQEQTAQRAEVAVLARALNMTDEPIQVVSDSRYTVGGAQGNH